MLPSYRRAMLACALFGQAVFGAEYPPPNLLREAGVKLSADSHHLDFVPAKAVDGNAADRASRWISDGTKGPHWFAADFGRTVEVNRAGAVFWDDGHLAVDYDIQVRADGAWRTVLAVRGNDRRAPVHVFPTTRTDGLRFLFLRTLPDPMVRVYELEAARQPLPVAFDTSPYWENGLTRSGDPAVNPVARLVNHGTETARLDVSVRYFDGESGAPAGPPAFAATLEAAPGATDFPLATPPGYGFLEARFQARPAGGGPVATERVEPFVFFPENRSRHSVATPYGAHYHYSSDAMVRRVGIRWWRNHDVYGRWNNFMDSGKTTDWSILDHRLSFVKRNGICENFVFLSAPKPYSTLLKGEPVDGDLSHLYSYYPPSDLDAWIRDFVLPVARKVRAASANRTYEAWNEAWSYYRLRGLHGTPGEAAEIFRRTYEAVKEADPEAIAFAADVKPERLENRYTFKNFGADMLELGYLRYCDVVSYHAYGPRPYRQAEHLRRNLWEFGRDLDTWCTETSTHRLPDIAAVESLVGRRSYGDGKIFVYNGNDYGPFMRNGRPTANLVVQAALNRMLGEALSIGWNERDGVRRHLFVNNDALVAVLFTDSETPVRHGLPVDAGGGQTDVYGRSAPLDTPWLGKDRPVFVSRPAEAFLWETLAEQLRFHAREAPAGPARTRLERLAGTVSRRQTVPQLRTLADGLRRERRDADSEFLYATNKALDLLTRTTLFLARRDGTALGADAPSLPEFRRRLAEQWAAVYAKSEHAGVLADTERLVSRAQKEMQIASWYDADGDVQARDLYLSSAAEELAHAAQRLAGETVSVPYRPKLFYRGPKRLIRSEVYCFAPDGREYAGVVTLANPLGRALSGRLMLDLPEGWRADRKDIGYEVPARSRVLIPLRIAAPENGAPGAKARATFRDAAAVFAPVTVELEIVAKVPSIPVLADRVSQDAFAGN